MSYTNAGREDRMQDPSLALGMTGELTLGQDPSLALGMTGELTHGMTGES